MLRPTQEYFKVAETHAKTMKAFFEQESKQGINFINGQWDILKNDEDLINQLNPEHCNDMYDLITSNKDRRSQYFEFESFEDERRIMIVLYWRMNEQFKSLQEQHPEMKNIYTKEQFNSLNDQLNDLKKQYSDLNEQFNNVNKQLNSLNEERSSLQKQRTVLIGTTIVLCGYILKLHFF
jgi:hypothetical protein